MITKEQLKQLESEFNIDGLLLSLESDWRQPSLTIFNKRRIKSILLPKDQEKITVEWVSEKINSYLNNPSKKLYTAFKKLGLRGNIYYTSFGFSYDCFMKNQETFDKETAVLRQALDQMGIAYSNEFSDAAWVYRFRISQSKENLLKII